MTDKILFKDIQRSCTWKNYTRHFCRSAIVKFQDYSNQDPPNAQSDRQTGITNDIVSFEQNSPC